MHVPNPSVAATATFCSAMKQPMFSVTSTAYLAAPSLWVTRDSDRAVSGTLAASVDAFQQRFLPASSGGSAVMRSVCLPLFNPPASIMFSALPLIPSRGGDCQFCSNWVPTRSSLTPNAAAGEQRGRMQEATVSIFSCLSCNMLAEQS